MLVAPNEKLRVGVDFLPAAVRGDRFGCNDQGPATVQSASQSGSSLSAPVSITEAKIETRWRFPVGAGVTGADGAISVARGEVQEQWFRNPELVPDFLDLENRSTQGLRHFGEAVLFRRIASEVIGEELELNYSESVVPWMCCACAFPEMPLSISAKGPYRVYPRGTQSRWKETGEQGQSQDEQ